MTLETIIQDLKYAVRGLRARPGFSIAVVATLGLGIGANAAMFGIVDRLLFRAPDLMKAPATVHRVYLHQTSRGTENANGPHLGDLQNITVGADSSASIHLTTPGGTMRGENMLLDADGAAVVVHATADDYKTDPSGNSGARIACGAIRG